MWGIWSLLQSQFTSGQPQCLPVLNVSNVLYIIPSHFILRVILCHHIFPIHCVSTRFITIDHPYSCRWIVHCTKVFCWHLQPTLNKFYLTCILSYNQCTCCAMLQAEAIFSHKEMDMISTDVTVVRIGRLACLHICWRLRLVYSN